MVWYALCSRTPVDESPDSANAPVTPVARVRVFLFLPWAEAVEDALGFVSRLPALDLSARVSDPADADLRRMARLDCDWHGETARCLAALAHPRVEFLAARVVGPAGLSGLLQAAVRRPADESWWLVFTGQHPGHLRGLAGRLCQALRSHGVRILFHAFDEASRTMAGFDDLAPHLDVLIHDESPLAPSGAARLGPGCRVIHRSWVANLIPFASPFVEGAPGRIVFLGSRLGMTDNRQRQVGRLQTHFGERFTAIRDHSLGVAERAGLGARFRVSLCPEGRKFDTPAMARTHTDRPFWSGCLGMIPVSEDSRTGGRLDELAADGLLLRYARGDLDGLVAACERALGLDDGLRRRIYDHYNRTQTVGRVIADAIAGVP